MGRYSVGITLYKPNKHTPSRAVMSLGSSRLYLCECLLQCVTSEKNVIHTGAHHVPCVLNSTHSLNSVEYHNEASGDKLFLQPCVCLFFFMLPGLRACVYIYDQIFTPYGKYWDFHLSLWEFFFVKLCKCSCLVFTSGFYGDQPLKKHWRQFIVKCCTLPSVCVLANYHLSKSVHKGKSHPVSEVLKLWRL